MFRFALLLSVACASTTCPAQVTIDMRSAVAVLTSVQDTQLTAEKARQACELPGNQGLIHTENSYGRYATTQSCADALLAAAQNKSADGAFKFNFGRLKPRAPALMALLNQIQSSPESFEHWVTARVAKFSPNNLPGKITGYLVVGGSSGGFAFTGPQFYLNLAYTSFDDIDVARVIMAHELYHAVQGAYHHSQTDWWSKDDAGRGPDAALASQCDTTNRLLQALYEEGSASYVGDLLLLHDAKSAAALKIVTTMQDGLAQLADSITLLELSLTGLNAAPPVSFDEVYAIGFRAPAEIEYKLGYVMAKAIATDMGAAALSALITQPRMRSPRHT